MSNVRVRFAPSPTGGLHLGGVRTVLFNYLFAKKHGGKFIVRIEDTDQTRFVQGAEEYIFECLKWCGITPDESVLHGGEFAPYRQSERKDIYKKYAEQLVANGHAYYAFDTPEEIEKMREQRKAAGNDSLQYDASVRMRMRNSLSLIEAETKALLQNNTPNVVRIKVNENDKVSLNDLIRGEVQFENSTIDDKVLLKADGMPTYHLAVVVDDYLMKITHAFRGEEWLPSAPVHVLLWQHLFGLDNMPQWAHLPLILKPDGNGKLSKRDGDRLGFPVYAMDWHDAKSNETTKGFKELGFLPEAFLNLLAMLGWSSGTEQEVFSEDELINSFSIERVNKAGAKFDYEKAKWFNHEWIKKLPASHYSDSVKQIFEEKGIAINDENYLISVLDLVKERCTLLTDFYDQAGYFFVAPTTLDVDAVKPKWSVEKNDFFKDLIKRIAGIENYIPVNMEMAFKELAAEKNIKPNELQLPFRIMLVGAKFGPGVFEIATTIGKAETLLRIEKALALFN